MSNTGLQLVLLTAIGFGSWPLVGRLSSANNTWTALIVMSLTALTVGATQHTSLTTIPNARTLGILCVAALLHALGFISFSKLITGGYALSGHVSAAVVLMIAITPMGGALFYHEPLSITKILGITCAILAALLLTR